MLATELEEDVVAPVNKQGLGQVAQTQVLVKKKKKGAVRAAKAAMAAASLTLAEL